MNLYGIQSMTTLSGQFEYPARSIAHTEDMLVKASYKRVASTDKYGYINRGKHVVSRYKGRYGEGYIVCKPSINPKDFKPSKQFMTVDYWIKVKS